MELPKLGCSSSRRQSKRVWPVLAVFVLVTVALYSSIDIPLLSVRDRPHVRVPLHAADTLAKCRSLPVKPGPPPGFGNRTQSDRYEPGTNSVLIRNASIWTGLDNGGDVVHGDILLQNGLIKSVGDANTLLNKDNVTEIDAEGAWVTPGIVDVHSHIDVGPSTHASRYDHTVSILVPE